MRKDLSKPCEALGPGDGEDPRYDRKEGGRVQNRKALQLCAQAAEAISLALTSASDPVLRDLIVSHVSPAPNAGRLLVHAQRSTNDVSAAEALAALDGAAGMLRAAVAAAVYRRKAPQLSFTISG